MVVVVVVMMSMMVSGALSAGTLTHHADVKLV